MAWVELGIHKQATPLYESLPSAIHWSRQKEFLCVGEDKSLVKAGSERPWYFPARGIRPDQSLPRFLGRLFFCLFEYQRSCLSWQLPARF
jgi:hypothetical protein